MASPDASNVGQQRVTCGLVGRQDRWCALHCFRSADGSACGTMASPDATDVGQWRGMRLSEVTSNECSYLHCFRSCQGVSIWHCDIARCCQYWSMEETMRTGGRQARRAMQAMCCVFAIEIVAFGIPFDDIFCCTSFGLWKDHE